MDRAQQHEFNDCGQLTAPRSDNSGFNRRSFIAAGAAATATTALASKAFAQGFPLGPIADRYPYPVWKVLDPRFGKYLSVNTPLVREWTGSLWAEGSA